jgi:hypothetical protein
MKPIAYINVEKRTLEFAKKIFWHTPTVANLDRIPLYTHQRTWVGLTDEVITQVIDSMPKKMKGFMVDWDLYEFSKVIEAKLKQVNGYAEEKNT